MFKLMKLLRLSAVFICLVLLFLVSASFVQAQDEYYDPGEGPNCILECADYSKKCSRDECAQCIGCEGLSGSKATGKIEGKIEEGLKSTEMNVHKWTIGDFEYGGEIPGMLDNIIYGTTLKILGRSTSETQTSGAVGSISHLITKMYDNPPASSVEYFADLGKNLGVVKPAYAQGVGFQGLNPILAIWKAFRNIAYLFFVFVFIVIGFAIMFRVKLDPQTVISIQNSLPKIVIALILVTFSYAIAGLLIDLIYVLISLIITLFGSLINTDDVREIILSENIFKITKDHFWFAREVGVQIDGFLGDVVEDIGAPGVVGIVGSALAKLIIAIAIIFSMFKLFFSLLMSYISIIVGVIFAPFMLMLEALPGQKGFSNWLKMMLSNIIVFPTTVLIFVLGGVLIGIEDWGVKPAGYVAEGWVPPLIQIGSAYTKGLIGIGIILLAPSIVDMVKKAVGGEGMAGIAAGLAGPRGVVGGVVGGIVGPTTRLAKDMGGTYIRQRVAPGLFLRKEKKTETGSQPKSGSAPAGK